MLSATSLRANLILLVLYAFTNTAFAYDNAAFYPLGFTADNKVFAYEYYGGSSDEYGGPHATIVFVNLDTDRVIAPTPIETRYEYSKSADEDLKRAILKTRVKAQHLFDKYTLLPTGPILAARVYGQRNAALDDNHVVFVSPLVSRGFDDPTMDMTVKLEHIKLSSKQCEHALGYRLTMKSGGVSKIVYEDKTLPKSRHCPVDYQLRYVLASLDGKRLIVVIEVAFPHLEGPAIQYIITPVSSSVLHSLFK